MTKCSPPTVCSRSRRRWRMAELPRIDSLLPHRGDALFVRSIESFDTGSIHARASVPHDSPYAQDGTADALLAIELAAQAAAAHGVLSASQRAAKLGMLVSVRSLELQAPRLVCG